MNEYQQVVRVSFYSSAKGDVMVMRYTVIELFADLLPSFPQLKWCIALGKSQIVSHVSLGDQFKVSL